MRTLARRPEALPKEKVGQAARVSSRLWAGRKLFPRYTSLLQQTAVVLAGRRHRDQKGQSKRAQSIETVDARNLSPSSGPLGSTVCGDVVVKPNAAQTSWGQFPLQRARSALLPKARRG